MMEIRRVPCVFHADPQPSASLKCRSAAIHPPVMEIRRVPCVFHADPQPSTSLKCRSAAIHVPMMEIRRVPCVFHANPQLSASLKCRSAAIHPPVMEIRRVPGVFHADPQLSASRNADPQLSTCDGDPQSSRCFFTQIRSCQRPEMQIRSYTSTCDGDPQNSMCFSRRSAAISVPKCRSAAIHVPDRDPQSSMCFSCRSTAVSVAKMQIRSYTCTYDSDPQSPTYFVADTQLSVSQKCSSTSTHIPITQIRIIVVG